MILLLPGDKAKKSGLKATKTTINSMAPTEEEMIKLGADMEQMETNAEVIESGMVPDPIQ
ncbi:hypothetical protein [Paenibacillus sp. Soil522]|uniref:hypothetical protein n=1 Tax=Paenibacillus sp. Soil522 TaxID=1736388 RepID=UPI0006F6DA31|nr:hypothetical protein [Paenibacillus sp. Soil522]KRE44946.1 hypothetical protein ASG81_14780 [Paenibacillus sp. Soil522]